MHSENFEMRISTDFYDEAKQLAYMKANGIDVKIVSLANPWVDCFSPAKAIRLAKVVNEELARMVSRHEGRLEGLAVLPLQDPEVSRDVLHDSVRDMGLRGAIMGTNVLGRRIDDGRYWPVYEEADRLGVPIFVHPTTPPDSGPFAGHLLVPALAFPSETTLTILRIIYSGLFLKFPSLKILVPHLGGTLPFLIGRVEKAYNLSKNLGRTLHHPPSYYVRRNLYADTIAFDEMALRSGIGLFGAEHLVLGTDYPFSLGTTVEETLKLFRSALGDTESVESVTSSNAMKLFGIAR